jgi:transcription antitermination protein NusB
MKLFARTVSRMAAIQAVFWARQSENPAEPQMAIDYFSDYLTAAGYELFDEGLVGVDVEFFEGLVRSAIQKMPLVQEHVKKVLPQGWALEQLEGATQSLFLCAGAEMIEGNTPKQVLLNEYINAAHHFLLDKGPGFVNGVLDSLWPRLSALVGLGLDLPNAEGSDVSRSEDLGSDVSKSGDLVSGGMRSDSSNVSKSEDLASGGMKSDSASDSLDVSRSDSSDVSRSDALDVMKLGDSPSDVSKLGDSVLALDPLGWQKHAFFDAPTAYLVANKPLESSLERLGNVDIGHVQGLPGQNFPIKSLDDKSEQGLDADFDDNPQQPINQEGAPRDALDHEMHS